MGYEEGLKHGYQDARHGKPATGKPPLGKALMRSRRYLDDYLLGYRRGYDRSRRERERKAVEIER